MNNLPTKTELAQKVKDWCLEHHLSFDQRLHPERYITASSSLAVAMEYLGKLDKDQLEYSSGRGGVGFQDYIHLIPTEFQKEITCLRDVLEMLPD